MYLMLGKRMLLSINLSKDLWYIEEDGFKYKHLIHLGLVESTGHKFGMQLAIFNLMIHFAIGGKK
jgi:hypothetical protein